jgi:ribosomal protein S18 acetylase RimI-like enzyme
VPRFLGPDVTEDVSDAQVPTLDDFAPLRVWLEPGYDGGRIAGWVPDVPGVLAVAGARDRVLSAALTTAGRVREWLEAHGDEAGIARIRKPEVEGEVPARHEPDGYEVNATLPADRRPVPREELAIVARRLGWAREDLLAVAGRIRVLEGAAGPLPVDVGRGERTPDEVLRHLAGAEAWLVGRLPGGGRFDGPLDGVPAEEALAGSRAWAMGRLAALVAGDDGAESADRHGETWTVAKVLRRLQAHGFDHLWEIERRLLRADGTRERIRLRMDRRPDAGTMVGLLRSVGWDLRASEPASLEHAIAATPEFAAAWDGDRLVGTARSLTDGGQNALIVTVVVHPAYQGLGIGERLVEMLTEGHDQVRFSLSAAPGLEGWYRKLGFVPDPAAMYRPRRQRA